MWCIEVPQCWHCLGTAGEDSPRKSLIDCRICAFESGVVSTGLSCLKTRVQSARSETYECTLGDKSSLCVLALPVFDLPYEQPVAVAGGLFQIVPVENPDVTPRIGNQSRLLQRARRNCDA